ncbi:MAG: copper amine oxidase N-terminal domain-containing protein [Clostridiales bacterium]|nr:copper amine oxidase N-terminal domain-containing protein [Clostridiales bacterium]
MKNTQRKLSIMLSIAIGITAYTPAISMASTESISALPRNIPIHTSTSVPIAQNDFTGAFATVLEVLENQIVVSIKYNSSEQSQTYVLNVSKETYFVDNQTGVASDLKDLQKDDEIYVYHSLASTRSLPPQTAALVILTNVKENESIATLIDVEQVTEKENTVSASSKDGEYIIHFTSETNVTPYLTKNILRYSDIYKGNRVLAWFDIIMPSLPAQATALKAVVLPTVEENITFAELIREIIVQLDGEKPIIMDTHYAVPYMIKAKELGLISDAELSNKEHWNQNEKAYEMETLFAIIKKNDYSFDFDKLNNLIIHTVLADDKLLPDARTIVRNGSLMVPLRAVAEALGFEVTWDASKSTAEMTDGTIKSSVQLGYNHYYSESVSALGLIEPQQLGSSPLLVDGRTYVPAELFNLLFSNPDSVKISDNILNISK